MEGMESFAGNDLVKYEQVPTEGLVLVKVACADLSSWDRHTRIKDVVSALEDAREAGVTTAAFLVQASDGQSDATFDVLDDEQLARLGLQRIPASEVQS